MGIEVGLDVCLIDPRGFDQTVEMTTENASQLPANVVGDLAGVVEGQIQTGHLPVSRHENGLVAPQKGSHFVSQLANPRNSH
jgi:hypothetical protein